MTSNEIDTLLMREQDDIAQAMGYIDDARILLENSLIDNALPNKKRIVPIVSAVAGIAAAAIITFMVVSSNTLSVAVGKDGRSLPVGSWVSSPMNEGLSLAFSDGSAVDLLNNTEVRLQGLKDEGAHLLIERGQIAVSVVHRSTTVWHVDAGPYKIAVTCTRFGVRWTPEQKDFAVDVQEGTITVEGPMLADGKSLSVGDRLVVSLLDKVVEVYKKDTYERIVSGDKADTDSSVGIEIETPDVETAALLEVPTPSGDALSVARKKNNQVSREPTESWKVLAKKGEWEDAMNAAERLGISTITASAPTSELMLLGDTARLARSYEKAMQIYKTAHSRFPGTSEAQRAAFTIGRIQFEAHGKYKEAVRWFKISVAENPDGTMAREAFGRMIEALDKSGDRRGAQAAAEKYLAAYRNGPHAELAKQILLKSSESL